MKMKTKTFMPEIINEDIVISGMSGRFPECDTVDEFAVKLYDKVDMVTQDNRRWKSDLFGMNGRMGKIKSIDKFDGQFFGIMNRLGDSFDPHSRIFLETTYEAIVDAGINPQILRGSDTGVYIGFSSFGMTDGVPDEVQPDSQGHLTDSLLWMNGINKCLYANRVSFVFDFKGPSIYIDTACSSSLVAFNCAINDMRLGRCNQAIVGGTSINLQPFTNHIFQSTHLNSRDGLSKVWDEKADGFVRGECVASLFLQKLSDSKRIYATVLNSGVNIDGNKRMGMFFPSSETQEELMCRVYEEAKIDPLSVNYFEAHATGTKAGDLQEAKAIYNAYCAKPKREGTLPIGLLKSNMGHAEGASGVSSVTKVLLAYERECIPSCLYLNKIKSNIKEFCPPLLPITDNYPYTPGIAGVNNFGVGGVNANVLLEPNYKTSIEDNEKIADTIPRLVNICARTEEGFNSMVKWIEDNPKKVTRDFLDLLTEPMKVKPRINSSGFPIRGSVLIKEIVYENEEIQREYKKHSSVFTAKTVRPIWFIFPGLGGQWVGMAKALMPIKIFADKIKECHEILKSLGVDLKYLLLSDDKNSMSSMTNKFCSTTAIEMALMDVMISLNIIPDGIVGHSFGEIAAAYADGCLTTEEALLVTYYRGVVTESDKKIPKGLMAVVGLSWNEAKSLCPKGVSVVCNNGKDTVVISGLYNETKQLVEELSKKGVFVRELQSHDIPYHSEYLMTSAEPMVKELKKCDLNPKPRSKKWISTAFIESDAEELKLASAEYFVHNLISPVYFYNKIKYMPMDAIVIEIGPHGLFSKIISETLDSSNYISLIKKDSNDTNLEMFLNAFAKMYELGINPCIENLYPRVEYPVVRGTQSISSLLNWDHSGRYFVRKWPDHHFRPTASEFTQYINVKQDIQSLLTDHCIDGNILFPATGYLMCAWRQLATHKGKMWNQLPVIFEDVQFRRPVFISVEEPTSLKVRYLEQTDEFAILENGNITCVGKIRTEEESPLSVQDLVDNISNEPLVASEIEIDAVDIYKELKIMCYDYGPKFRGLRRIKTQDFETLSGEVEWNGNWIPFMDSLLQTMATAMPFRKMMVPVMIKQLRCDPKVLYEAVAANKIEEQTESGQTDGKTTVNELQLDEYYENFSQDFNSAFETTTKADTEDDINIQDFHIYKSKVPFYIDMNSRMIVAPGIEVEDLMALPIPRKFNIQDLKIESYEFIANEEYNSIEECDRKSLSEYLMVCSTVVNKIHDSIDIKKSSNFEVTEDLIQNYTKNLKEDHIMLRVLTEIQKQTLDKNQNVVNEEILKEVVSQTLAKPENDLSSDVINRIERNERLIRSLLDIVSENNVPKRDIKVFEINLTNSLMVEELDNHLASAAIYPIEVDYNIAVKSIESVNEELKKRSFKITEWDLKKSNFPSDVILNNLVVIKDSPEMWNLKVEDFVQELYDCINPMGFLISILRYRMTEPEMALNKMNSKHVSHQQLVIRINEFKIEAERVGFNIICSKCDSIGSMALLFRKVNTREPTLPSNENIIEIRGETDKWFDKVKQLLAERKESDRKDEHIWLIASDTSKNGIIGLINCLRLEPGGEAIRCIFDYHNLIELPINFREKPFSDIFVNDLAVNVLKNGKLGTYRHLSLPEDYDKIQTNEYFLNNTQNRDISSLQWFDLKNLKAPEVFYNICDNSEVKQIHCNVYMAGINFRDVMLATGRITAGPQSLLTDCLLGLEFAGRRCDTGERVMGFEASRCFASSLYPQESLLTTIPDHWSMEDAATILCTYSTVWYGIIERAQMKTSEKILIHSGAGGVGQAAINICKYFKCDIFVTVGTDEKKKFLMTEYSIPENRIFSSRDIQFKFKIKQITKGKGVDIVLNSLTGNKLDASYECVANCGRFVEIGKYDLQMNKKLGMFSFLKDICFIGLSVDQQLYQNREFAQRFFNWMHKNSTNGMIKPINRSVFGAEEAEKAFRYMTTGKHIGKILIKIRDEENQKVLKTNFNLSNEMFVTTKTYFDPNKVYIITGGLGGFGLELVHWMLFSGARRFVLNSRYGIKNKYQNFVVNRFEALGEKFKYFAPKILVSKQETNTIHGSNKLIKDAQELGSIGGVFHLALVLNDGLFEKQIIEKFNETVDSKSKIFDNLDKISRDMKLDLDYFVVFSSVACGKGNVGQSNYSYANSICERICELRKADGLNGLAIQWGPIGDVGVLADTEMTSLSGIVKQRINSCFEVMDKLLQVKRPVVSCIMRAKRVTIGGTQEARIASELWSALGIDPKTTPDHLSFGEIGMESLVSVELQQRLERDYDIKISLNDIKYITIGMMRDFESGKIDELRKFTEDIKESRNKLSKIKFIIPSEDFTRLNNVKNGRPVYLLPTLEGLFTSMEPLAEMIDRPVLSFNWVKETENLTSLKDITKYFMDLLNALHPNGDYDIVGHFYGALIAIQMLKKRAPINKAVIIDRISDIKVDDESISEDFILESIVSFFAKELPKTIKDKFMRDISVKPDVNSKLAQLGVEIKEWVGKSQANRDLDAILMNSFKRAKLFSTHIYNKKRINKMKTKIKRKYLEMSGKLLIIKLNEPGGSQIHTDDLIERMKDAYYLPEEGFKGKVVFEAIEGNPEKISSEAFDKISKTINEYLKK